MLWVSMAYSVLETLALLTSQSRLVQACCINSAFCGGCNLQEWSVQHMKQPLMKQPLLPASAPVSVHAPAPWWDPTLMFQRLGDGNTYMPVRSFRHQLALLIEHVLLM